MIVEKTFNLTLKFSRNQRNQRTSDKSDTQYTGGQSAEMCFHVHLNHHEKFWNNYFMNPMLNITVS